MKEAPQNFHPNLLSLIYIVLLGFTVPSILAAPAIEDEALEDGGCFYMFNHYGEGDRILTNEPCLNCTCHNSMLMCYLRVCPFTKPIGQDCTIEKKPDQCCPVINCPQVSLMTPGAQTSTARSTTTALVPEAVPSTGLVPFERGCRIGEKVYSDGAQIEGDPTKPCELCYCIRNKTACVMQECILHVDGCEPVFQPGVCCPVRYQCDYPPRIADTTTPVIGLITTTVSSLLGTTQRVGDCVRNGEYFADGSQIPPLKQSPCEHCYCMRGEIVCAVQECGSPLENEGRNCTAIEPREGLCCPEQYECDDDKDDQVVKAPALSNTLKQGEEEPLSPEVPTSERTKEEGQDEMKTEDREEETTQFMAPEGIQEPEVTTVLPEPNKMNQSAEMEGENVKPEEKSEEEHKRITEEEPQRHKENAEGEIDLMNTTTKPGDSSEELEYGKDKLVPTQAAPNGDQINKAESDKDEEQETPEEMTTAQSTSAKTEDSDSGDGKDEGTKIPAVGVKVEDSAEVTTLNSIHKEDESHEAEDSSVVPKDEITPPGKVIQESETSSKEDEIEPEEADQKNQEASLKEKEVDKDFEEESKISLKEQTTEQGIMDKETDVNSKEKTKEKEEIDLEAMLHHKDKDGAVSGEMEGEKQTERVKPEEEQLEMKDKVKPDDGTTESNLTSEEFMAPKKEGEQAELKDKPEQGFFTTIASKLSELMGFQTTPSSLTMDDEIAQKTDTKSSDNKLDEEDTTTASEGIEQDGMTKGTIDSAEISEGVIFPTKGTVESDENEQESTQKEKFTTMAPNTMLGGEKAAETTAAQNDDNLEDKAADLERTTMTPVERPVQGVVADASLDTNEKNQESDKPQKIMNKEGDGGKDSGLTPEKESNKMDVDAVMSTPASAESLVKGDEVLTTMSPPIETTKVPQPKDTVEGLEDSQKPESDKESMLASTEKEGEKNADEGKISSEKQAGDKINDDSLPSKQKEAEEKVTDEKLSGSEEQKEHDESTTEIADLEKDTHRLNEEEKEMIPTTASSLGNGDIVEDKVSEKASEPSAEAGMETKMPEEDQNVTKAPVEVPSEQERTESPSKTTDQIKESGLEDPNKPLPTMAVPMQKDENIVANEAPLKEDDDLLADRTTRIPILKDAETSPLNEEEIKMASEAEMMGTTVTPSSGDASMPSLKDQEPDAIKDKPMDSTKEVTSAPKEGTDVDIDADAPTATDVSIHPENMDTFTPKSPKEPEEVFDKDTVSIDATTMRPQTEEQFTTLMPKDSSDASAATSIIPEQEEENDTQDLIKTKTPSKSEEAETLKKQTDDYEMTTTTRTKVKEETEKEELKPLMPSDITENEVDQDQSSKNQSSEDKLPASKFEQQTKATPKSTEEMMETEPMGKPTESTIFSEVVVGTIPDIEAQMKHEKGKKPTQPGSEDVTSVKDESIIEEEIKSNETDNEDTMVKETGPEMINVMKKQDTSTHKKTDDKVNTDSSASPSSEPSVTEVPLKLTTSKEKLHSKIEEETMTTMKMPGVPAILEQEKIGENEIVDATTMSPGLGDIGGTSVPSVSDAEEILQKDSTKNQPGHGQINKELDVTTQLPAMGEIEGTVVPSEASPDKVSEKDAMNTDPKMPGEDQEIKIAATTMIPSMEEMEGSAMSSKPTADEVSEKDNMKTESDIPGQDHIIKQPDATTMAPIMDIDGNDKVSEKDSTKPESEKMSDQDIELGAATTMLPSMEEIEKTVVPSKPEEISNEDNIKTEQVIPGQNEVTKQVEATTLTPSKDGTVFSEEDAKEDSSKEIVKTEPKIAEKDQVIKQSEKTTVMPPVKDVEGPTLPSKLDPEGHSDEDSTKSAHDQAVKDADFTTMIPSILEVDGTPISSTIFTKDDSETNSMTTVQKLSEKDHAVKDAEVTTINPLLEGTEETTMSSEVASKGVSDEDSLKTKQSSSGQDQILKVDEAVTFTPSTQEMDATSIPTKLEIEGTVNEGAVNTEQHVTGQVEEGTTSSPIDLSEKVTRVQESDIKINDSSFTEQPSEDLLAKTTTMAGFDEDLKNVEFGQGNLSSTVSDMKKENQKVSSTAGKVTTPFQSQLDLESTTTQASILPKIQSSSEKLEDTSEMGVTADDAMTNKVDDKVESVAEEKIISTSTDKIEPASPAGNISKDVISTIKESTTILPEMIEASTALYAGDSLKDGTAEERTTKTPSVADQRPDSQSIEEAKRKEQDAATTMGYREPEVTSKPSDAEKAMETLETKDAEKGQDADIKTSVPPADFTTKGYGEAGTTVMPGNKSEPFDAEKSSSEGTSDLKDGEESDSMIPITTTPSVKTVSENEEPEITTISYEAGTSMSVMDIIGPSTTSKIPTEGSCLVEGVSYPNGSNIPLTSPCQLMCTCQNSIVHCVLVHCKPSPSYYGDCRPIYKPGFCCPDYDCESTTDSTPFETVTPEGDKEIDLANVVTVTPQLSATPSSKDEGITELPKAEISTESSKSSPVAPESQVSDDKAEMAHMKPEHVDDQLKNNDTAQAPIELKENAETPVKEEELMNKVSSAEPTVGEADADTKLRPEEGAKESKNTTTASSEGDFKSTTPSTTPGTLYPVTTKTTITPSPASWPYPSSTLSPAALMSTGTCLYNGKVYMSAQQIPMDDPCQFCFCFRGDVICLQQSCPPPIPRCYEEPIPGFCCPRYECPVGNNTATPQPLFPPSYYHNQMLNSVGGNAPSSALSSPSISSGPGCEIQGEYYATGEIITSSSGPCLECRCEASGMICDPRVCQPEPMLRKMIAAITSR